MAKSHDISISTSGLLGFMEMEEYQETQIFFDATSAGAHKNHHDLIAKDGKQMIDLTPAAIGPYSQAILNNNTLYCSGQIAINPKTGNFKS